MCHSVTGPRQRVDWPRARYGDVMRVHVDGDKCQGHNRCYAIAPELFDVDDLGYAHELDDGVVPPGSRRRRGSRWRTAPSTRSR